MWYIFLWIFWWIFPKPKTLMLWLLWFMLLCGFSSFCSLQDSIPIHWADNIMSLYYLLLFSGCTLVVCFWAEVRASCIFMWTISNAHVPSQRCLCYLCGCWCKMNICSVTDWTNNIEAHIVIWWIHLSHRFLSMVSCFSLSWQFSNLPRRRKHPTCCPSEQL